MRILKNHSIGEFDRESIREYRRRYDLRHENGAWTKLTDEEFLIRIGAAKRIDENVYPTAAGLLMFGQEYMITNEFPEYFLDFREKLNPDIRWTDRAQSQSGDWSGNVFDFFCTVYRKITADFKRPFVTKDSIRQEEGPRHLGVREAIANCLVNTDYFQSWSVVIEKYPDRIEIANPGLIRVGKKQMMHGGISEPRNKVLLKMFNQIGVGEHAGSGVPEIFDIWKNEGLKTPEIREQFGPDKPDRTILILPLEPAGKASNEANYDANEANYDAICKQILELLKVNSKITQIVLAESIGVSRATVQRAMKAMAADGIIKRIGATRGHWEITD